MYSVVPSIFRSFATFQTRLLSQWSLPLNYNKSTLHCNVQYFMFNSTFVHILSMPVGCKEVRVRGKVGYIEIVYWIVQKNGTTIREYIYIIVQ
jgi:hypothetical protein